MFKLRFVLVFALLFNFGCSEHEDLHKQTFENTKTISEELQIAAAQSDRIVVKFATRVTDIDSRPISYVDKNAHIFTTYQCYNNCAHNVIIVLKQILKEKREIVCQDIYFVGKVSFFSKNTELWNIYMGHNTNFVQYNETCYELEQALNPVVHRNGIFLWNPKIKH